jgi:P27 family predicted phage terminase small subunit
MKGQRPELKAVDGGLLKTPAMPSHLPADMKDEWRITCADLVGRGLLTTASIPLVETYVGALWMARECRKAIEEYGVLVKAEKGQIKPNPAAAMLSKASETIARLGDDLGISAVSRSRPGIRSQTISHDEETDPISKWL